MSLRNYFMFWACVFAGFIGFVFIFSPILMPFALGFAVAYFLNPTVNALSQLKLSRSAAALIILLGFLSVVVALCAVLAPIVYKQIVQLSADMPGYFESLSAAAAPHIEQALALLGYQDVEQLKSFLAGQAGTISGVFVHVLQSLLRGGQAVFDLLSVIVFMPIVAYFMMKEWPSMTSWIENMIPKDQKKTIGDLLKEIDAKVSGFVRGQVLVALILAAFYAIALSIAGLEYGFLVGLMAGLLSIIPMFGSIIGLISALALAWFQGGDLIFMAAVAGIFLFGQIVEGNVLTPKLVGDRVGLHPLWVFFALLAGGSLFGILGMLLAVPVAAVAGVLLSFGIAQYKMSTVFKGTKSRAKPKAKPKKKPKKKIVKDVE